MVGSFMSSAFLYLAGNDLQTQALGCGSTFFVCYLCCLHSLDPFCWLVILDSQEIEVHKVEAEGLLALPFKLKPFRKYGSALHIELTDDLQKLSQLKLSISFTSGTGAALCWLDPVQTAGMAQLHGVCLAHVAVMPTQTDRLVWVVRQEDALSIHTRPGSVEQIIFPVHGLPISEINVVSINQGSSNPVSEFT